jgi:hypothetical protein
VCLAPILSVVLFKHQSAKVLGVVASSRGTAYAGKEATKRKTKRVPRNRRPGSVRAGFIFSK